MGAESKESMKKFLEYEKIYMFTRKIKGFNDENRVSKKYKQYDRDNKHFVGISKSTILMKRRYCPIFASY